ncbi:hypothetical protein [Celeribacter litoreus]|uniref:hypothetical protein n=1 Tax=Celeribacter litoreus TaxID=2876714 RepID=UPI001CCD8AA7|nr:hypothetical protein [Celeribacter litoreus]
MAIPVLHSSGAWIASTAASGYVAGTLSSTWVGAFILGNAGLLTSSGLVSATGLAAAASVAASSSSAFVGATLSAVGLGGLAQSLGLVPVTFLGLTPVGWVVAGAASTATVGIGYLISKRKLSQINEEREKGGLDPIGVKGIIDEIRAFEERANRNVFTKLSLERADVNFDKDHDNVEIRGEVYRLGRLRYVVNVDGSEEVFFVSKVGRKKRLLVVKPSGSAGAVIV